MEFNIEKWKEYKENQFPDDISQIQDEKIKDLFRYDKDFEDFKTHNQKIPLSSEKESKFQLGIIPNPFIGDIYNASIYIFTLNPGFIPSNYFFDEDPDYKLRAINTLEGKTNPVPFFCLDPKIWYHPAYKYWEIRFRRLIFEAEKQLNIKSSKIFSYLGKNVAVLELIPYHSRSFSFSNKDFSNLMELNSVNAILDFTKEYIFERIKDDKAIGIVQRKANEWNLPDHNNILKYRKNQSRGGYIIEEARKHIINWIKKENSISSI